MENISKMRFGEEPTWKNWRIPNINITNTDFLISLPYDPEDKTNDEGQNVATVYDDDLRRFLFELYTFEEVEKKNGEQSGFEVEKWCDILDRQIGWEGHFSNIDNWVPGTTFYYKNRAWVYMLDYDALYKTILGNQINFNRKFIQPLIKKPVIKNKLFKSENLLKIRNGLNELNEDENPVFLTVTDYNMEFASGGQVEWQSDLSKAFDGYEAEATNWATTNGGVKTATYYPEIKNDAFGLLKFKISGLSGYANISVNVRLGDPIDITEGETTIQKFDSAKTMHSFNLYYSYTDEDGASQLITCGDNVMVDELTPDSQYVGQIVNQQGDSTWAYQYSLNGHDISGTYGDGTFIFAVINPRGEEGDQERSICIREIDITEDYVYAPFKNVLVCSRDPVITTKFGLVSADWEDSEFRKYLNTIRFRKNPDGSQGEIYYPAIDIDDKYLQEVYINVQSLIKQLMGFNISFIEDLASDPHIIFKLMFTIAPIIAANGDITPQIKNIFMGLVNLLPDIVQIIRDYTAGIITDEEELIQRIIALVEKLYIPEFLTDKISILSGIIYFIKNLLNNLEEYIDLILEVAEDNAALIAELLSEGEEIDPEELAEIIKQLKYQLSSTYMKYVDMARYIIRPTAWPDKDSWTLTAASFSKEVNKAGMQSHLNYYEPTKIDDKAGVPVMVVLDFGKLSASEEVCRILPGRYTPDVAPEPNTNKNKKR